MSFFRAMRTSEIDYGSYYASRDRHKNLAELEKALSQGGGEFTRLAEGRIDREFPARGDGLGKMNVVVIASESFGAEFSKLYGSKRDWTPEFDRFAQKSLWFRHMYASGTRTVRGLEAITASFPPIPSVSIVRRPGNENIANWGSVMRAQGYSTSFLYGGYGYFDNMNYFYANNGFEVLDRKSITRPTRFENIWGVADEDLYDLALDHFDDLSKTGKPFFAIIMNTSNHKPFTFRAGVPGVKPAGGGRESGVRYADFAQGYFLEQAERHGWFDNTLFVVVADHGARVYGKQDIPIKSYEIPMLIYAPKRLNPQRVDALTTQIDVAPTVLGLLGLPYRAPFFGQDVLHTKAADRVVFFSHNHDVAILRGNQLAILGLQKSTENFFYDAATDSYRPAPRNVELNDLAIAYYQTASELFHERRYN
jgi:phosphoglycerol transferase MdoB-like AlkP superfamily enzyme